ncbi:hypothetical protein CsSME_00018811 [Camellia sinensis var. sinensis]
MGNKLGRRRQVVDEKYTRPQGLYQHRDVDHKKLRKLILDSKLAPCYPGDEECGFDLEECPICFLYYPSLNRSRCCTKGICTECFLQMKTPNSTRPTQCPFCKTLNYAVEYRGGKTKEEKGIEQIESGRHRNSTYGDSIPSEQHMTEDQCETAMPQLAESSSSPSGGLACAIAALAERQQTSGESSGNYDANMSTFNALPSYSQFSNRGEQETECYHPNSQPAITRYEGEWGVDHGSEVAEVGTSSGRSDTAEDGGRIAAFPPQHEIEGGFQTVGGPPIIPESFEEQMMLAMAVSLAEARARTSAPGLAWQ